MKNLIVTILIATLSIGGYGYIHYEEQLSIAQKTISTLQEENKTKSTEIANLENVIVEKEKKLDAEKLVIEKRENQLQKVNAELHQLKSKNSSLKKEVDSLKSAKRQEMPSRGSANNHKTINVLATSYVALCDTGCTGITKTGIDVRNYPSKKIIAVDPKVIPLHSKVKVSMPDGESFFAVAEDTGGDIKGNRIDILMATHREAIAFGKQRVSVTILN